MAFIWMIATENLEEQEFVMCDLWVKLTLRGPMSTCQWELP